MASIRTNSLLTLWTQKEQQEGRRITLTELSTNTGLAPETIRKLLHNRTHRFDASVVIALCKFFSVSAGPIPFIIYEPEKETTG
jgi:DNA-binding Xre family transcriptional regulator